jgi:hypothetical protein
VVGLAFLYRVVVAVPGLFRLLGLWLTTASSSRAHREGEFTDILVKVITERAFSTPIELLLYSVAAWYFLKGAPSLARFITRHAGQRATA